MRLLAIFAVTLFVSLGLAHGAQAAPKAELWKKWASHDEASTITVDHGIWDKFLKNNVIADPEGLNRIDYAAVSSDDQTALEDYLQRLSATKVTALNRAEQQALWINLYNALTVMVVLDYYPVETIREIDISPGLFADGPWGKALIEIEGEQISLDDIEHRILRPIWKDPRLHYAVNCASVGCPDLLDRAYRVADMDATLTANAVAYINSPRGVDLSDGGVVVSSIYDWFEADFGGNEAGVLAHLKKYAKGGRLAALKKAVGIDGYVYDWKLNGR